MTPNIKGQANSSPLDSYHGDLTTSWERVEESIKQRRVPFPAWVNAPGGMFGWGKLHNRWQLLWVPDGARDPISVVACPIQVRISCAFLLPCLEKALKEAEEAAADQIVRACTALNEWADKQEGARGT